MLHRWTTFPMISINKFIGLEFAFKVMRELLASTPHLIPPRLCRALRQTVLMHSPSSSGATFYYSSQEFLKLGSFLCRLVWRGCLHGVGSTPWKRPPIHLGFFTMPVWSRWLYDPSSAPPSVCQSRLDHSLNPQLAWAHRPGGFYMKWTYPSAKSIPVWLNSLSALGKACGQKQR